MFLLAEKIFDSLCLYFVYYMYLIFINLLWWSSVLANRIGSVMFSGLSSKAVDREFDPRLDQTNMRL
jgi:hypothetical protein